MRFVVLLAISYKLPASANAFSYQRERQRCMSVFMIASHEFDCWTCHKDAARRATMMVEGQGYILSDSYIAFRLTAEDHQFGMRALAKMQPHSSRVCQLMPQLFPQISIYRCMETPPETFLGLMYGPQSFKNRIQASI